MSYRRWGEPMNPLVAAMPSPVYPLAIRPAQPHPPAASKSQPVAVHDHGFRGFGA